MPEPGSILTHHDRQGQRLQGAINRAWKNPDDRADIRKLQRLVDAGQMTVTDALGFLHRVGRVSLRHPDRDACGCDQCNTKAA